MLNYVYQKASQAGGPYAEAAKPGDLCALQQRVRDHLISIQQ